MKNESSLNIYQRINNVMKEVTYIKKDSTVGYGNNSYTAVSHDNVTQSVSPAFVKHGIAVIPSMENVEITRYEIKTKNGTSQRYETQCKAVVRFVNIDDPTDLVVTEATAHGFDTQDKSCGKAYSMAVKYCYLKTLMLASGDEEEMRIQEESGAIRSVSKSTYNEELSKVKGEVFEIIKSHNMHENKEILNKLSDMKIGDYKAIIKTNKEGKNILDHFGK